jgi:hypothetical protein
LLNWFISISDELCSFLFVFFCFWLLGWNPWLILLIWIEIVGIPTAFHLGNIRRFSLSKLLLNYLSFNQLMPAKNGCAFIYYTPFTPNLSLGSVTNFLYYFVITLLNQQPVEIHQLILELLNIFSNFVFYAKFMKHLRKQMVDILLTFHKVLHP